MCKIKRDFEEKTKRYVTGNTPINPGLFRNSFDRPYFLPTYYQIATSDIYTQKTMLEFTFPVHNYLNHINYCSPRFRVCNSLSKMTLMASYIFARMLRTPYQFTCLFMMTHQTHGTRSNITNTPTERQMWICRRRRKIAGDYEVPVCVVIYRHHTCREHHRAQLWYFSNKFQPTIRMLGASDQDQFPFPVQLLRSTFSDIVHIDFSYAQFPSWNICCSPRFPV